MMGAFFIEPVKAPSVEDPSSSTSKTLQNLENLLSSKGGELSTAQVRLAMQKTMQEFAAVFRTQETLDKGSKKILEVAQQMKRLKISDTSLIW